MMSLLYILTSVWVLCMPNTGWNSRFQWLLCLNAKKRDTQPAFWCKVKKNVFFQNFVANLLLLCFLAFQHKKIMKMTISTSVWHAQHTNSGQNIQHVPMLLCNLTECTIDMKVKNNSNLKFVTSFFNRKHVDLKCKNSLPELVPGGSNELKTSIFQLYIDRVQLKPHLKLQVNNLSF